jgi:hypothetical protein
MTKQQKTHHGTHKLQTIPYTNLIFNNGLPGLFIYLFIIIIYYLVFGETFMKNW